MIAFHKSDRIEDVVVYEDYDDPTTFYLLPTTPRYRLGKENTPVFQLLTYVTAVDRPGGMKAGGFLIFDVELAISEDQRERIRKELQKRLDQDARFKNANPKPRVVIGQLRPETNLPIGRPACTVQLFDSGGTMVQKIQNPGAPSLFGNFVTPITVELTQDGAALAEAALQGKGGAVQISYDLPMRAKCPPATVTVDFSASKFLSFHQDVHVCRNIWGTPRGRQERINEFFAQSEYSKVDVKADWADEKTKTALRDWGYAKLEEAVKRMLLPDASVSDKEREVDGNLSRLTRDIVKTRIANYHASYTESMGVLWNPKPQGTLENITSFPGVKWENHWKRVNLDADFFRTLNVNVYGEVDFQELPISSVDVTLLYPGAPKPGSFHFTKPDVGKFTALMNKEKSLKYKYSYKVNYKTGQSYQSPPVETEAGDLTINGGATGVLTVDLQAGDLNFDEMRAAQVTMRYEPNGKPAVEQQFMLDKDRTKHRFQKVTLQPIDKPYKYKVKYMMKDGKEFIADWQPESSPVLMINDAWSANRTVNIVGRGNFEGEVEMVSVDLVYRDETNKYTQTKSVFLDKDNRVFPWTFPVINEDGGTISYSGTIKYANNAEEAIPKTDTTTNTIFVGPKVAGFVEVELRSDLLDWSVVKLVKATVLYADPANSINVKKDFIFKEGVESLSFKVEQKDKTKSTYDWQAEFFLHDGTKKKLGPTTSNDATLLLEVPE